MGRSWGTLRTVLGKPSRFLQRTKAPLLSPKVSQRGGCFSWVLEYESELRQAGWSRTLQTEGTMLQRGGKKYLREVQLECKLGADPS